MEGTWPLRLDGVECGTVTASRSGVYTLITARALYAGAIKRVSLYGSGQELVLGVLAPEGEYVTLTRKFTRSALAAFTAAPEYAAESGLPGPDRGPKDGPKREEKADTSSEATEKAEPETAPPAAGELWYSAPDGSLSRFDGERLLVALPSENVRVPEWARGVVRRINGREFVVFPR